jgi:hypothetical protein
MKPESTYKVFSVHPITRVSNKILFHTEVVSDVGYRATQRIE